MDTPSLAPSAVMPLLVVNSNEFSRLYSDGADEMKFLIHKYPLTSLVCFFVLNFLGLLLVFSFSVISLAAGVLLGSCGVAMGRTIVQADFWRKVRYSLGEILIGGKDLEEMRNQISTAALYRTSIEQTTGPGSRV